MSLTATVRSSPSIEGDVPFRNDVFGAKPDATSMPGEKYEGAHQSSVDAVARRQAARLNASSIRDEEIALWISEHKNLVAKKFTMGLDNHEERRLRLVGWSLDRIQDAKYGHTLDDLERAIDIYERVGEDINRLIAQMNSLKIQKRHR